MFALTGAPSSCNKTAGVVLENIIGASLFTTTVDFGFDFGLRVHWTRLVIRAEAATQPLMRRCARVLSASATLSLRGCLAVVVLDPLLASLRRGGCQCGYKKKGRSALL